MWVFMLRIKKFYNLESTTIYVEMNISFVIIWCMRFPNLCFRIQLFNGFPYVEHISAILQL